MKNVYLAGPIEDASDPASWRKYARKMLAHGGLRGIDPFSRVVFDNPDHPAATDRSITDRDHFHATRCDALLVNFTDTKGARVSIGTVMEIAWAYDKHIPIVIVSESWGVDPHFHCMIRGCASFVVESIDRGLEMIFLTLGGYAS